MLVQPRAVPMFVNWGLISPKVLVTHYKGNAYELLQLARREKDLEYCIVYRSVKTGEVWVRPQHEVCGYVWPNNYPIPRFGVGIASCAQLSRLGIPLVPYPLV